MKVGIDARFSLRQPRRGIGTYSMHLLTSLVAIAKHIDFIIYIDRDDVEGVLPSLPNIKIRKLKPSVYPLWEQFVLPIAVLRDKLDLLHTLGNTAPLWMPARTKLILSLMDVMFLQSGEFIPVPTTFYQRLGRIYRSWVAPTNARCSSAVITISNFSRQDILHLIPYLAPEKVVPIHLSCDPHFSLKKGLKPIAADRSYLLCLGAEDPRKNTLRIVQCYLNALQNYDIDQDLVICGYARWEGSPSHLLVQAANAEARVRFLPFISTDDLIVLYQQATALLYISLYEGFGIPILEAFTSGCPVIASNSTSIPEVGGDAAIYVDPTNTSAIEEAIVRLCNDSLLQSDLRRRGYVRAKCFSWEKVALETLEIYHRVLPKS